MTVMTRWQIYEGNIGNIEDDEEDTRRTTDTAEGEGLIGWNQATRSKDDIGLQREASGVLFGHHELSPFLSVFAVPDDEHDCSEITNLNCTRCPIPDAFATPLHVSWPSFGLFLDIPEYWRV